MPLATIRMSLSSVCAPSIAQGNLTRRVKLEGEPDLQFFGAVPVASLDTTKEISVRGVLFGRICKRFYCRL